jgi:hypothetical protein
MPFTLSGGPPAALIDRAEALFRFDLGLRYGRDSLWRSKMTNGRTVVLGLRENTPEAGSEVDVCLYPRQHGRVEAFDERFRRRDPTQ